MAPTVSSAPVAIVSSSDTPSELITQLVEVENDENNNLIQILGILRPSNSSQTSITSFIRGLFTKNKTLLKLLDQCSKSLEAINDLNDEKQVFKHFINEFLMWLNDDVLILFNKFRACLESPDLAKSYPNDSIYFSKPIMHLSNYIKFIDSAVKIVRNPYIVEQLKSYRDECDKCLQDYVEYSDSSRLVNINFNQVQLFGDSNNIKNYADNVCSYFKVTQIVERSKNTRLVLENARHKTHIELLLVNLNGLSCQPYNALALLCISPDNSSRTLMFPPFRLNELSLSYSNSNCQLILKSIRFTAKNNSRSTDKLIINCPDDDFLAEWVKKLSTIFPLTDSSSPINSYFQMKLNESPQIKMAGLGIDMLSDSSHSEESDTEGLHKKSTPKSDSSPDAPQTAFKELISSPSLSAPVPTLQVPKQLRSVSCSSQSSSIVVFNQPVIPPFVKSSANSAVSSPTDSFRSVGSYESTNSTSIPRPNYDRSLSAQTKGFIIQNNLQVQNIRTGVPVTNEQPQQRPVSSSAEIQVESEYEKENVDPVKSEAQDTKKDKASSIDISNFGKNHNPSFSVHKGLNQMLEENERPKSKFFDFFKKSNRTPNLAHPSATPKIASNSRKSNSNIHKLNINTSIPMDSDSDTIPLSAASAVSNVSTVSQTKSSASLTQHANGSGTAFALPSSTSTYFFRQYKDANSSTRNEEAIKEASLSVPQELKNVINDENSIDFYISPTSPKALKVSKWKAKYGKWEMLTLNENVFIKIVVNYDHHSSWMIFFKEEYDAEYEEEVDKPILLLEMNSETDISQSSALDVQISAKNSITNEVLLVMVRCSTNNLAQAIVSNVSNIKGALAPKKLKSKASYGSSIGGSKQTIASSVMENNRGVTSKSSTVTSFDSSVRGDDNNKTYGNSQLTRDLSMASISSEDITNAAIMSNPENGRLLLLTNMKIRLQKSLGGYEQVNNPSSWKILSMFSLSIYGISDTFTDKNYFSIVLERNGNLNEDGEEYSWLICEDEVLDRIERIGKAGLLVKVSDDDLFMIECKGKKELKQLYEVF
ncbi:hypothetical protein CANTEDRAFT_116785 [Yamadazyma tenuis ATCC 10573]|uniref:PH-like domain-containing protein n=3 Tax=Candida tenuis TaxID=2315449 RepID=G3BFR1_CANTC|nr:uncharacterized protein CANTEDRAFT_116785 [Yamadazyma tenuis ATCC 10573]EGV60714.1 hypothetical protein CANTEDRAFT_116785 [Yamadazyma tenuis ATCC 10573]